MSEIQQTSLTSASGKTLLTFLETLPDALFVVDDTATILYANASAHTIAGSPPEDICGKSLWRGVPQVASTELYHAVQEIAQTRIPGEVEYVSPVMGTWLHVQLSPMVGGLMMQIHQGRTSTQSQEMVPRREYLSINDLDGLYSGIILLTPDGIVLEINEIPLAYAQIRREEVIGQPLTEAPWWSFYLSSQAQLRAAITRASRGETVHFETVVHPRESMDHHLEVMITPHRGADCQIEYLIMAGINITARKQAEAEQQLKASEENWHMLAETMPQLVWIERADGSVEYVNQRYIDYLQAGPEQLQRDGWSHFVHEDDAQRTLAAWRHACESGEPYEIEYRLKQGHTGAYRWFLARALPVRNEADQILKWFGTCTDIDEQKRAEEALRQSQERANVLMNSNIIGIFVDEADQIVDANDTFLHMTGYTRADLRAGRLNWLRMTPPEYLDRTLEAHQELATRQSIAYEKEYICQDGSRLPVLVGHVVLQHYPSQTIGFVLDISARKELEQRKDTFISMASHELRNPLAALKLQTALLHRRLARQGIQEQVPAFARMEAQINKVTRLVAELLDVSKIQAGGLEYRQEAVDLDALLREVVETMRHTHPSHHILVQGHVGISLIGDRDRLGQVFTNLLSNAIKYSPHARTVEVELTSSSDVVTIRVIDHGQGIPREQLARIFDRFYRVADPRQRRISGLGMGLYIVAEIVKAHGGSITVDSEVEKGSTFTVTFPARKR